MHALLKFMDINAEIIRAEGQLGSMSGNLKGVVVNDELGYAGTDGDYLLVALRDGIEECQRLCVVFRQDDDEFVEWLTNYAVDRRVQLAARVPELLASFDEVEAVPDDIVGSFMRAFSQG